MPVVDVPEEFQPQTVTHEVLHQKGMRTEQFVHRFMRDVEVDTEMNYLPVYWTRVYINEDFGKGRGVAELHNWVKAKTSDGQQYWTVCEYDDGVLMDVPENLKVWYCGHPGELTLPLLSDPRPVRNLNRVFLASFTGNPKTHLIREKVLSELDGQKGMMIEPPQGVPGFECTMASSYFALCPRGYGLTSFRLYEAIQMGTVPVYISDQHILPRPHQWALDWGAFCLIEGLDNLSSLSDRLNEMVLNGTWQQMYLELLCWARMFTPNAICLNLKRWLEHDC